MRTLSLIFAAMTVGCGIPDETLMSDLDDSDVEKLCGELASDSRDITCSGDGYEITVEVGSDEEECATDNDPSIYDGCDVTVGDVRDCTDAWDALTDEEICSLEAGFPDECEPLLTCAFGG